MNKIIILVTLCLVSFTSYAKNIAPLGGSIVDEKDNVTIEYTRFDGSVITKFSTSNDWYLKKKSEDPNAELPNFVKINRPITIVYTNLEGQEYASMNLRKWVKYESTPQITTQVETETKLNNLELIQHPENPVENEFLIKFKLMNSSNVEFQIINTQGVVVKSLNQSMSSGLNTIEMNLSDLGSGSYFYKIIVGNEILNKKFIKIK